MKPDTCIYIVSFFPIFSEPELRLFPMMDRKHSSELYKTLLLNHREILRMLNPQPSYYYCLDERDMGFVPEEIPSEKLLFYHSSDTNTTPGILLEKYYPLFSINLFFCANTIGINSSDIKKILDILNMEEEAVVIGRSNIERAAYLGLNYDNPELLEGIKWDNENFDSLLSKACMYNNSVSIFDGCMLINNLEDLKFLYSQLSKKESLAYCSQEKHERFTNIFIEYKDILK